MLLAGPRGRGDLFDRGPAAPLPLEGVEFHAVGVVRGASHADDLRSAVRLHADGVAEARAVSCHVVAVVAMVVIIVVIVVAVDVVTGVFVVVGEGAAAEAELDQRLQGWEAGAGDAD